MIISIDGIDGVGKGTQSKKLYQHLTDSGINCRLVSFPRYDSFFGRVIASYLNGEYGDVDNTDPYLVGLVFAMDRKDYFANQPMTTDCVLICDRYVASNIAHQAAKLSDEERGSFIDWLQTLEYQINAIERPALSIYLDVDIEQAVGNVDNKKPRAYTNKKRDIHERNKSHLRQSRQLFAGLAQEKNSLLLECSEGGRVLSIEEVFAKIKEPVEAMLADRNIGGHRHEI